MSLIIGGKTPQLCFIVTATAYLYICGGKIYMLLLHAAEWDKVSSTEAYKVRRNCSV